MDTGDFEPKREEVKVLGTKYSLSWMGKEGKPPLVMLHGVQASSWMIFPLAKELAPDFHLFLPDLKGFGESAKPKDGYDPFRLIVELEVLGEILGQDFFLLGHSLGGIISYLWASLFPGRMKKLVLLGAPINPFLISPTLKLILKRRVGFWVSQIHRFPPLVRRELKKVLDPQDPLFPKIEKDAIRASPHAMTQILQGLSSLSLESENLVSRIKIPTLIIQGERDDVVFPENSRKLKELIPQSELFLLSSQGHFPFFDQAPLIAEKIRSFLLQ